MSQIIAIIPCYNAESQCRHVVDHTSGLVDTIITIDDGSTDHTLQELEKTKSHLIRFPKNKGKGHALIAGFKQALTDKDCRWIVTLDADGQHDPKEISHFIELARKRHFQIVVGSRGYFRNAPLKRKLANWVSTGVISLAARQWILDAQSGFRLFTAGALKKLLPHIHGGRFETETEILIIAARMGYSIGWVPIHVHYSKETVRLSTFRDIPDSLRIARSIVEAGIRHMG